MATATGSAAAATAAAATVAAAAAAAVLYLAVLRPFVFNPLARAVPSAPVPFWWALVGNLPDTKPSDPQLRWVRTYGPMLVFHGIFNQPRLIVASPAGIRHVLVTNAKNYPKPALARRMLIEL
ncbi:hypothetical protein HK405_007266, partial [Cladochytrium tenue]